MSSLSGMDVLCWGSNAGFQIGDGTGTDRPAATDVQGLADAVDISAGGFHSCARRAAHNSPSWFTSTVLFPRTLRLTAACEMMRS